VGNIGSGTLGSSRRDDTSFGATGLGSTGTDTYGSSGVGTTGSDTYGSDRRDKDTYGSSGVGATGTDSYGSDRRDDTAYGTTSQGERHQSGGDSTLGKMMEKAGNVLNNKKLEERGQQKREEKAFGNDN
jgi:hypothetical protein